MESLVPLLFNFNANPTDNLFQNFLVPRLMQFAQGQLEDLLQKSKLYKKLPGFDALDKFDSIVNVYSQVKGTGLSPEHLNSHFGQEDARDDYVSHEANKQDLDQLYTLFEEFVHESVASPASIEHIEAIRKFSGILLELHDDDSTAPSLEEKFLLDRLQRQIVNKYGKQNITDAISTILTSTSALLLPTGKLKSNIPNEIFSLMRQWLKLSEIKIAHSSEARHMGNALNLHQNTVNLIASKPMNNIHEAVSKILFGTPQNAEFLQLACYQLLRDNHFSAHEILSWTNKQSCDIKAARMNMLLNITPPMQITIATLSKVIERNIILHLGSHSGGKKTLSFGNYSEKRPVEVMELDNKIYPLIPLQNDSNVSPNYIPITEGRCCGKVQKTWAIEDPKLKQFGEFTNKMIPLFEICTFCQEFGVEKCTHVSRSHGESLTLIRNVLRDNKYGMFDQEDIPSYDIDIVAQNNLPDDLASKFVVIKNKEDGQCLYSACSYSLTKTPDMAVPLRRCTQIDYIINKKLYEMYFIESKTPKDEIQQNIKVLNSLTKWGNSFSIALLSKITNRKIVVFESGNKHVTYDVTTSSSSEVRPIFLYLENNHFQTLIPKIHSSSLLPKGRQNQYKILSNMIALRNVTISMKKLPEVRCSMQKENQTVHSQEICEKNRLLPTKTEECKKLSTQACVVSKNISDRSRVKFPWNRSTTKEENVQLSSLICSASELSDVSTLQIDMNGKYINISPHNNDLLTSLQLSVTTNIPANKLYDYRLYSNCIIHDICKLSKSNHQEDFVRVFVHRSSFDSYWNSNISRVKGEKYKTKHPKEFKNQAKNLRNIQYTDIARELTMEIMARAMFSKKSIVLYSNLMKAKLNEQSLLKARKGNLIGDLNAILLKARGKAAKREKPTYSFDGLLTTKELESEMRSKMGKEEAIKIDFRIDNLLLPDSIGQSFLDNMISDKEPLPSIKDAEDVKLPVKSSQDKESLPSFTNAEEVKRLPPNINSEHKKTLLSIKSAEDVKHQQPINDSQDKEPLSSFTSPEEVKRLPPVINSEQKNNQPSVSDAKHDEVLKDEMSEVEDDDEIVSFFLREFVKRRKGLGAEYLRKADERHLFQTLINLIVRSMSLKPQLNVLSINT